MNQTERLTRRAELRAQIERHEAALAALRAEEQRLLDGCDHTYADGRHAAAGANMRVCSVCGKVLNRREEKLWG